MGWKDRKYGRRDEGGPSFPFVQVVHRPGQIEPRPETGGFFQPTEEAEVLGASIPGTASVFHTSGGSVEGVFAPGLQIAVLATRQVLIKGRGEDARRVDEFGPGVHSKVQAACLVRSNGKAIGPVTLTMKSTVASTFWKAYRAHRREVRRATGGKAPSHAFFVPFAALETQATGEGGMVTVFGRLDGDFDADGAYVGGEVLDGLDWELLDAWAAAWGTNGNRRNGPDPEGPATEAQWDLIQRLMVALGYEDEAKQTGALVERGYDPEKLTCGDADALIGRLKAARAGNGK